MNLVKPTKQHPRALRSRGVIAPLAGLALFGLALAQVSCAEGGTVNTTSTTSSTSNTGSQGGNAGNGGSGGFVTGGGGTGGTAGNGGTGGTAGNGGTGGTGGTAGNGGGGNGGGPNCVAETCDGLDNDCDGTADNGDPGGGSSCVTNLQGACAVGVTKCEEGKVECFPSVEPGQNPETCNGLDDDCDGAVDEDDPGGGGACMAAAFGECKAGTEKCENGGIKCKPGAPQPEVCDGLDNNCDGNTDEGNPGGGLQCMTAFQGICASGVTQCDGAAGVICEPGITFAMHCVLPPEQRVFPGMHTPGKAVLHGRLLSSPGSSMVPLQSSSCPLHVSWIVPGLG